MRRGRENQRLVTCLRAHCDDIGPDPRISIRARGGSCAAIKEAEHTTAPDRVHRTTEDPRSARVYLAHGQPRLSTRSAGPALRSGPVGEQPRPTVQAIRAGQPGGWPAFHGNNTAPGAAPLSRRTTRAG